MTAPGRVAARTIGTVKFTASEVNAAIDLIEACGIVPLVEPLLPTGGRPRQLTPLALFTGMLLLARSGQPSYLNRVPTVLNSVNPSAKRTLDLPPRVTARMVRVLFGHIAAVVDASPNYAGKGTTEEEQEAREARLQELLDRLIAATLPDDDEYTSSGDLVVDATIIEANSRVEATRKRKSVRAAVKAAMATGDATALEELVTKDKALAAALGIPSWGEDPEGHREAVHRAKVTLRRASDKDATTLVYKGKLRHSYAIHFAVEAPSLEQVKVRQARKADEALAKAEGRAPSAPVHIPIPHVVRRLIVTASTAAPAPVGAKLLADLAASPVGSRNGWAPSDAIADRGYTNATPDKWHDVLRAAGFSLVHDLHPSRRGHTASHDGVVIIDGQAYSPAILDYPDLVDVPAPRVGASRKAIQNYQRVIESRRPFLLPNHGRPTPGSPVRVTCPALRGNLGCPLRGTLGLISSKGVPEVFTGPTAPLPAICTNTTVRLPVGLLAHAQDSGLLYGSLDWYDAFTRRRPRVEGANGIVKNPAGAYLEKQRIRVRSRAKTSLLVVFVVAALNLAAVEAWRAGVIEALALNEAAAKARRARKPVPALKGRGSRGPRPPARAPAA